MGFFSPCCTEMLEKWLGVVCGKNNIDTIDENNCNNIHINGKKVRGTVVLMKKNVLDLTDVGASLLDRFHEVIGKGVSLQLISADHAEPGISF
uniref:Lipoxygenase n=1 Tax=Solanum tuberosum TaxID=4113 RepID=M1D4M8_SOLTU